MGRAGKVTGAAVAAMLCSGRVVSAANPPLTLQYYMTVRDFLPSHCMRESAYREAWDPIDSYTYTGLTDSDYENEIDLEGKTLRDQGIFDQRYDNNGGAEMLDFVTMDKYCPYFDEMLDGAISGHPDFEPSKFSNLNGPSDCYLGGVRSDTCGSPFTSLVSPTQVKLPSGLFKIQSCEPGSPDERNGRCGFGFNDDGDVMYSSTTPEYFSSWYNDNAKYNRRVGLPLTLELRDDVQRKYEFNARTIQGVDQINPYFKPLNSLRLKEAAFPNVAEVPVWPNSFEQLEPVFEEEQPPLDFSSKYWFTVEIHTFFEYRGDEVFTFEGDDDVWVFINNRLAVDLGGLHEEAAREVRLSDFEAELGLERNKTFHFDLYQAERHYSASNFRLETTLSAPCNIIDSGTEAFRQTDAQEDDIVLGGAGASFNAADNSVALTSSSSLPERSTYMFLKERINAGTGFELSFNFRASQEGTHNGFAVVLYGKDTLADFPTSTGRGLGFQFLENAVAVSFDLCGNSIASGAPCLEQKVSMYYADDPNSPLVSSEESQRVTDSIMRSLKVEGESHSVRIVYFEDPDWFEVYVDDSLYLREEGFDLTKTLDGRDAFIGVTTSITTTPGDLTITDMAVRTVLLSAAQTSEVAPNEAKVFQADGIDFGAVTVQTRDFCGNLLGSGGSTELMKGIFVENIPGEGEVESSTYSNMVGAGVVSSDDGTYFNGSLSPNVVEAEIVDNNDGTFSALLRTTVPGTYSIFVCFGECRLEQSSTFQDELEIVQVTAVDTGGNSDFILIQREGGIVGFPPTNLPTSSPIEFLEPEGLDPKVVTILSIVGGLSLLCCVAFGFVASRRRQRWVRERAFIEAGRAANLNKNIEYGAAAEEYDHTGRKLQDTRVALMRAHAQGHKNGLGQEVTMLEQQNRELRDQVRQVKQANMTTLNPPTSRPRPMAPRRQEFRPSVSDL